jgi:hypothetical protein
MGVAADKAAQRLLDCLVPGVVLTIGGREIDHTELNDARQALEAALKAPGMRCTQCGWPVDTDAKPEFGA